MCDGGGLASGVGEVVAGDVGEGLVVVFAFEDLGFVDAAIVDVIEVVYVEIAKVVFAGHEFSIRLRTLYCQ